ncbi:uncharacterized protein TNCV_28701 [Trichonephila clavipes]|uniref:Uncharacterized protein n=1 Tax=Trichonephila clavipes TaxID=2585209 RepID=A0A8X6WMD7_TRICX|nr:uncharacterized protein TNCV_28701 [Trichonephila clavipes]
MEYRHPGSPSVKKFKTLISATKVMLTIFWDVSGVLHMEFLTKGLKVNSDSYCVKLRLLKQRICRIRPWFHSLLTAQIRHRRTFGRSQNYRRWKGQCFATDAEVQVDVRKRISSQPEYFCMDGMKKWIERLNKCVAISGDYVEKQVYNTQRLQSSVFACYPTPPFPVAAVAEWYRHRYMACFVTGSSPVPLKTRRVGQPCTLNLSRAETSSRWCGVEVRRGGGSSDVVQVT